MKSPDNKISKDTSLKWNRVTPAAQKDVDDFWKKLRQFYRTGNNSSEQHIICTSALMSLLPMDASQYPVSIGDAVIALDENSIYHLLNQLLKQHQKDNRDAFKKKLTTLISGLSELLQIDDSAAKKANLHQTFDFANELIAFDKMIEMIPKSRSEAVTGSRLKRLKTVINQLQQGLRAYEDKKAIIVIDNGSKTTSRNTSIIENAHVIQADNDIFNYAATLISDHIQSFASLIIAYRIAVLEIEGAYKEEIHDQYFEHFTWHRFVTDELILLPPMFVMVSHDYLLDHLTSFSKLVAANQPVKVIVSKTEYVTTPNADLSWEDASHRIRQEVAALTIAHRNVYTFQSTMDRPKELYDALGKYIKSTLPGVCHLSLPSNDDAMITDPAVIAIAQNAGRYFPSVVYDPENTGNGDRSFDLSNNMTSSNNWPKYMLTAMTPDETEVKIDVAFTYADYKAIYPQKSQELMIVPPSFYTEHLIPLSDYLELAETQLYGKIPYIWLTDNASELHRAAVPHVWVVSCQERLDYWNFLQVLGKKQVVNAPSAATSLEKQEKDELPTTSQNLSEIQREDRRSESELMSEAVQKVISVLLEDIKEGTS
ncbi:MAG: hypothetical protein ACI8QD_001708 [Cyclobacteriaceae bacterium]|jgi:hypothetical protein